MSETSRLRGASDMELVPMTRPVGQVVKTRPFHGCNMGSNPVRVTKRDVQRPAHMEA